MKNLSRPLDFYKGKEKPNSNFLLYLLILTVVVNFIAALVYIYCMAHYK